ncbi:transcriptional regulator [Haloactinopolyspora alba]|uniref:Transcriptional regulator n=1 Tax=Haloactinopolyspora alba TaxID=648780 RepID=A0A2P8DYB3_9ACTN|nr:WYL domain-containing protein [Haloactinopolyspora alba]PSL02215.1 transcriptional regulator [Haloactinopolyspora alba]
MAQAVKSERLMNLVICLLVARGYVPKSRIRQIVGGYGDQSEEAFERMFERDKEELREVGIPIETGSFDPFGDEEPGYRIHRQEFELPEIRLEPDEAAVVGLAARMWQHTYLSDASTTAVTKLQAVGVEADTRSLGAVEPRVGGEEPAFWPLWEAVRDRRAVRFRHRKSTGAEPMVRHVQPWSVLSWHGRWYVVGYDVDRQAPRMFRLSRIVDTVRSAGPAGGYEVPAQDVVREAAASLVPPERNESAWARIRVRAGSGHALRRRATHVEPAGPGWDDVTVTYSSTEMLAEELVTHAGDVVALEPAELRAAVVERLEAITKGAS